MAVTRSNVLVGVGTFSVNGVDVGATFGGVEVEKSTEFFEKKVDQYLAGIQQVPINTSMKVNTNIAEATLENLKVVWNENQTISSSATGRTLAGGIVSDYTGLTVEKALVFNGKSPAGYDRAFTIYKAVAVGGSKFSIKKDDQVVFPVSFTVVPDLTKSAGAEFFSIQDKVS